jgi:hypothetical protein
VFSEGTAITPDGTLSGFGYETDTYTNTDMSVPYMFNLCSEKEERLRIFWDI